MSDCISASAGADKDLTSLKSCRMFAGGFFDGGTTSADHRRQFLLDLLKSDDEGTGRPGVAPTTDCEVRQPVRPCYILVGTLMP